ncbi:Gti1/Pac2 family-domain-containing protein [Chytriomyces cf. hyalinus JEL632]|nr:Gti1/Pac2 family-domain-containing protein [Chytriomyces cf. hyalinus JEL632]
MASSSASPRMQQPAVWHPQPPYTNNSNQPATTPGPSRSHPTPFTQTPLHSQQQRHTLQNNSSPYPTLEKSHETFYGFIHDRVDALILVEACVQGILTPMTEIPIGMSLTSIRSGTVIVFAESTAQVLRMRWRDGGQWSSSRISGSFLLYRQVESTTTQTPVPPTLEKNSLFITTSLRPYTRILPNGLAKRTISIAASTGQRYRVINYFYPSDVDHYFTSTPATTTTRSCQQQQLLKTPSMIPAFHQIKSLIRGTSDPRIPNHSESPLPIVTDETPRTNPSATSLNHNLLHQFEKNAIKHGGQGLQQYIPFFKSNPSWHNNPTYLPPLLQNAYSYSRKQQVDNWS